MYSLVLAAALATGTTVPQSGACYGCAGALNCGGSYSYDLGCLGCLGWGSGYGAYGYGGAFGCAGGAYACMGCYGGYQSWWSGAGGYGGYDNHMLPPGPDDGHAAAVPAGAEMARRIPTAAPALVVVRPPQGTRLDSRRNPADVVPVAAHRDEPGATSRITVRLPAEARLFVNGLPCPLPSDTRTFETPPLEAGREYTYTLQAQVKRDGENIVETKQAVFRAGEPVTVDFGDLRRRR